MPKTVQSPYKHRVTLVTPRFSFRVLGGTLPSEGQPWLAYPLSPKYTHTHQSEQGLCGHPVSHWSDLWHMTTSVGQRPSLQQPQGATVASGHIGGLATRRQVQEIT